MQRLASATVLVLSLSTQAEGYKIRRWAEMHKKKPLSEQLMSDITKQYDTVYSMGFNALVNADASDSFKVQERFGINLEDKMAEGTGLHSLKKLHDFAAARQFQVDEPEVPKEWLHRLRTTFDLLEKEMLRMNAALAYAAGHQDLVNADNSNKLRAARDDFLYHGKSFERGDMWALRSWYWVWKMQGFPDNGYEILKDKMNANLQQFEKIQEEMWEAYGEPSNEFTKSDLGSQQKRMSAMHKAVNAMF